MDYTEIINNTISFFAIISFLGLLIFYIKILNGSKKIKKLNKEIEVEIEELNNHEIEHLENKGMGYITAGCIFEIKKQKLQNSIEKLKRQKEYILEKISIYKIFKK
ncbi:hypothetical protein KAJ41_00470 [Candidatus Parcubacteria bacterium]|nr:hypothetical protein [Candidatus Parcubacteria bacterium]